MNPSAYRFDFEAITVHTADIDIFFDHAPELFFIYSSNSEIIAANRHACERLGFTRDELLSMRMADIGVGHDGSGANQLWTTLGIGAVAVYQSQLRNRRGDEFPIEMKVSCQIIAGEPHYLAVVRDVSEQAQTEEKNGLAKRAAQCRHASFDAQRTTCAAPACQYHA